MKPYLAYFMLLSLTWAGLAQAHAHLQSSQPANNSTLVALPKHLQLEFTQAVRLTALRLNRADAKVQDLAPLPAAPANQVNVPLPEKLPVGDYVVQWRAVSADGHVMSGSLLFKLVAKLD